MKYYYLKDNRIWVANEKMPKTDFNFIIKEWLNSLQPCEISETLMSDLVNYLRDFEMGIYSPIPTDISDLVYDNNGVITFKEKQVDGEIEAVEFAEWLRINCYDNIVNKWSFYSNENYANDALFTSKQLYEIFKTKK